MRYNQKGFSLVELVITIAILSFVGLAIIGLLSVGTNSYRKVSSDVDLQYEAQLTFNQMKDVIIDASKAVYFDDTNKVLTIYDNDHSYEISYMETEPDAEGNPVDAHKLYLTRNDLNSDGSINVAGTPSLMAEYVEDFLVALPEGQASTVVVTLKFATGNRQFESTQNFTLRNMVYVLTDPSKLSEIYGMAPVYATVTGVSLYYNGINTDSLPTPNATTEFVSDDMTVALTSKVEGSVNPLPSQDVTWQLVGYSGDKSSIDATGKVSIGKDENASALTVLCTSVQDTSASKTFTINLNSVNGLTLALSPDTKPTNNGKFVPGSSVKLVATYKGTGDMNSLSAANKSITWKDATGKVLGTTTDGTFTYNVKDSDAKQKVTIYAYYKNMESIKAQYSFDVDRPNYGIRLVVSGDYGNQSTLDLKRGNTGITYKAEVYDLTTNEVVDYDKSKISWSLSGINSSVARGGYITCSNSSGDTTTVKCSNNLDYNTSTTATINVCLSDNTDIKASRNMTVDKVGIKYQGYPFTDPVKDTFTVEMLSICKKNFDGVLEYYVHFELTGIENAEIYFANGTKDGQQKDQTYTRGVVNNTDDIIRFRSRSDNAGTERYQMQIKKPDGSRANIGGNITVVSNKPDAICKSTVAAKRDLTWNQYGYNVYYDARYIDDWHVNLEFKKPDGSLITTYRMESDKWGNWKLLNK